MVSETIPDPDVEVYSVWPRNSMGHNEDVVSAWGCLSHPTSDMGRNFLAVYKYVLLST